MKIVIGNNALALYIHNKWENLKYKVKRYGDDNLPKTLNDCDELFVSMSQNSKNLFNADSDNISKLTPLLRTYNPAEHGGKKLLCHLLLYSQIACNSFHSHNLADDINNNIEIWPFTMEDVCAKNIIFDRKPISIESKSIVHLVIYGFTQWTEAIVKYATIACHYPNYTRDHTLRTRITIIDDDIELKSESFVSKYHQLFNNSYIRHVDIDKKHSKVSRPIYWKTREDFVDIEWEFVNGHPDDDALVDKLGTWGTDENQQLTIALCYEDDDRNMALINRVINYIKNVEVPIYVKLNDCSIFHTLKIEKNIFPMCISSMEYDVTLPERKMGQIVNYIYSIAFSSSIDNIQVPAEIDIDTTLKYWEKIKDSDLRWSSVCNAMSIRSKMHSLGHDESDWNTFYSISAREINAIAEVEHNRWSVEKLVTGYRPLTDEEQKIVADEPKMGKILKNQKAHFALLSYNELGKDETGKNVQFYDIYLSKAIPLIASTSKVLPKKSTEEK